MIVTKNNIIVESDYIRDVITNPLDYTSIEVSLNLNCCANNCNNQTLKTIILPISPTNNAWYIDLTKAVNLAVTLGTINFASIQTYTENNALLTPIDLGYIEDICGLPSCTLEAYSTYFNNLIKPQLDSWFLSIGTVSNIAVTFEGNIMKLTGVPTGFIPTSVEYGSSIPYTKSFFNFGALDSNLFLAYNALYVLPGFLSRIEFIDGVYNFKFKFNRASGYVTESNCAFVDITTKCKVANLLTNLTKDNAQNDSFQTSTVVHLLHYSLTNSSSCGCNCDEMCKIYKELYNILNGLDPQTGDCGC